MTELTQQNSDNTFQQSLQCKLYPIEANENTVFYPYLIIFDELYDNLPLSEHKAFLNAILTSIDSNFESVFSSVVPTDMNKINFGKITSFNVDDSNDTRQLLSVLIITHQQDKIHEKFQIPVNTVFHNFYTKDTNELLHMHKLTNSINVSAVSKMFPVYALGKQSSGVSVSGIQNQNMLTQRQQQAKSQIQLYIMIGVIGLLGIVLFYFIMKRNQ